MRYFLISDDRDTLVGMRLAGIEGVIAGSRDEVRAAEAGQLVEKLFDGSPELLFASLLGSKRLTAEQIARLRSWIDEQE